MADSRSRAGNGQDDSGKSFQSTEGISSLKQIWCCQKPQAQIPGGFNWPNMGKFELQ